MDETLNKLKDTKAADSDSSPKKPGAQSFMDFYRAQEQKRLGLETKGTNHLIEETDTLGGYLVPEIWSSDLIEVIRAQSVVMPRATVFPMTTDTLNIPRIDTGSSTYWEQTGGFTAKTKTDQTYGQLQLVAKSAYGYTELSEQLAEDSNPQAVGVVQNDLAGALMAAIDTAFLEGAGSGTDPITGIVNQSNIGTATMGAALTGDDILDGLTEIENNNHNADTYAAHPSVKGILRKLKDSTGRYLWNDTAEGEPATMFGVPFIPTANMTATAGSRDLIIGEFSKAAVGMRRDITMRVSDHYNFKDDRLAVRLTARVGFGLKYAEAFYTVTSI